MKRISVRVEAALHSRLQRRGAGANLVFSTFIRRIFQQAADPGGCYIHSSQDEILATRIQILSALAASVACRPEPVVRISRRIRLLMTRAAHFKAGRQETAAASALPRPA